MEKRYLVTVYNHDDWITLESSYFEKVSGGKCQATKRMILTTESTYEALIGRANNFFDYDLYANLTDRGDDEEANKYYEINCKDIGLDLGDYFVQDLSDLNEIIEDNFDGELQVIHKQPRQVNRFTPEEHIALDRLSEAMAEISRLSWKSDEFAEYVVGREIFCHSIGDLVAEINNDLVTAKIWRA